MSGSGHYGRGGEGQSSSLNSMVHEYEELQSQLAAQHDALLDRQTHQHENATRAGQLSRRMEDVDRRLRQLLSDSAEMARHNRRGKSARMPGTAPGVDPYAPDMRHMQILHQREQLEAEIYELGHSRDEFNREARRHAEAALTIRQIMGQIQERIKRLKKEIEKAEKQERHNNKRGGGGPRGGGAGGGGSSRPQGSSDKYYDGGWSGGDYDNYLSGGGQGQQDPGYSYTQNRSAGKVAGHATSHRGSNTLGTRARKTKKQ